jgi:hypothetical protein
MIHDAAVDTKMKYLHEDHNLILVMDNKMQVGILQNLKNLGGMAINPTNKVAALFELGPNAQVVALEVNAANATQSKRTQQTADIISAEAIGNDSIHTLRAPTCRDTNFNGFGMFIPAPFLQKAILEAITPCPFEIIKATISAHILYVQKQTVSSQETLRPTATCSSCGVWKLAKTPSPKPITPSSRTSTTSRGTKQIPTETGKIIDKERLTHNQSYKWSELGASVNSRIVKELLMLCMHGTCLRRLINWTIAARRKYPGHLTMACKIDFKLAF